MLLLCPLYICVQTLCTRISFKGRQARSLVIKSTSHLLSPFHWARLAWPEQQAGHHAALPGPIYMFQVRVRTQTTCSMWRDQRWCSVIQAPLPSLSVLRGKCSGKGVCLLKRTVVLEVRFTAFKTQVSQPAGFSVCSLEVVLLWIILQNILLPNNSQKCVISHQSYFPKYSWNAAVSSLPF